MVKSKTETFSGNKGLHLEELLIFEQGAAGRSGVDLPDLPKVKKRLGGLERQTPIGLPGYQSRRLCAITRG